MSKTAAAVLEAASDLADAVDACRFAPPVAHVVNPLRHAWGLHQQYVERFASGRRRVVFLGMNPGPFGMLQTGVPFGEIAAVRDWMGITGSIESVPHSHPKRPIQGLECPRSEVSGRRLWGAMAERFGTAKAFFAEHFVLNFCPLAFMEDTGRNRTPDKLPADEREPLYQACDTHLQRVIDSLKPEVVVGVGRFARDRAEQVLGGDGPRIVQILHPSPASPLANRGWAEAATKQMVAAAVWSA